MANFARMERCQSLPQPKRKQKVFQRSFSFSLPKSPNLPLYAREHELQDATPAVAKNSCIQEPICPKKNSLQMNLEQVSDFRPKERKLSPGSYSLKSQNCMLKEGCECELCKRVTCCIIAKSKVQENCRTNVIASKFQPTSLANSNLLTEVRGLHVIVAKEELSSKKSEEVALQTSQPPTPPPPPPLPSAISLPVPHPPPVPPLPPTSIVPQKHPENEPMDKELSLASEERGHSLFGADDFGMDIEDYDHDDYDDDDSWNGEHLCVVCFCSLPLSTKTSISCAVCLQKICSECMQLHLRAKIMEGFVLLKCPGDLCTRVLTDDEVSMYCKELLTLYIKNKVDAENDPKRKTCPGCNIVHNFDGFDEIPLHHKCSFCGLQWCVPCHAPWHIGMTCKMYNKDVVGKGRKALKVWAKGKGKDSANARKCPKCHFFIERISGCDHMVCTKYVLLCFLQIFFTYVGIHI